MFCDKCGQELDNNAVSCPNCGNKFKETPKSNEAFTGCLVVFFIPFIILCVLIAIGSTASDNATKNKNENAKQESQTVVKPRLEVLKTYNCQLSEYGGNAACGVVINNTNRTMSYVQVEINLYDMNDNQIGSTMANVNNLAAGSKWVFKAPVMESGSYRWSVSDVSGW